ncbi:hypothetical protein [Spirillospora sp. NPDC048819]|uniref:hypothetical protein n=1 Tax=Spirillospora sp. NPDC048819 TaxID=3155268 RepID=UPI0033E48AA5
MKSRISGRLLPAALIAATVTAIAAPAMAQAAPPPAEQTYNEAECAQALQILAYFKLLPDQPDVGRALCSMNAAEQKDWTRQDEPQQQMQQEQTTKVLSTTYTADNGKAVKETKPLGTAVVWPESLMIQVPTIDDQWHSYIATQN